MCFFVCRMRRQAERWGAELYQEDVESIDVKTRPFTVHSSERKVMYYFAPSWFCMYVDDSRSPHLIRLFHDVITIPWCQTMISIARWM